MQISLRVSLLALAIATAVASISTTAQTLDQRAWAAVWDKLNTVLPKGTPTESVHALQVIVPATWAKRDRPGLKELQTYAGALPEEQFSIDPSRLKLSLHQAYSRFVLDVDLPGQSSTQQKAFEDAKAKYGKAFDDYLARLDQYEARWEQRQLALLKSGEKVDTRARLDFRDDMEGFFSTVQGRLDTAADDVQKFAPVDNHWIQAIRALRDQIDSARSDIRGVYSYDGGEATLDAIKNDCVVGGQGWEVLGLSKSLDSTSVKSSDWNANGAWGGNFFSVGLAGGASNYDKVIETASDSVELQFCNLTYITLRPGAWFDVSFLQAIDSGELTIKKGSSSAKFVEAGKKILGPNGAIPRLVKGAVVARSIRFMATMDETRLVEMRKSFSGSGGIRIGPWSIGGGGGSSEFKRDINTASGKYGRSTATDVPVILAVITEPTR